MTDVGAETPGTPVQLTPALAAPGVTSYAWSPDASKLLYQVTSPGGTAELWVVSLATPGVANRVSVAGETVASYTWLRAGAVAAYATAAGDVEFIDLSGAVPGTHQTVNLPTFAGYARSNRLSPSSNRKSLAIETSHSIAMGAPRYTFTYATWNGAALPTSAQLLTDTCCVGYGSFSYDGSFGERSSGFEGSLLWNLSSGDPASLQIQVPVVAGLAWSPTAEGLLNLNWGPLTDQGTSRAALYRWSYAAGTWTKTLLSTESSCVPSIVGPWSPDGKSSLFSCSSDMRIFPDVATAVAGADRSVLPSGFLLNAFTDIPSSGWSPNSQWLALRADPVADAHYDVFLTRPSVTPPLAYQPYTSSADGVSNWWFSPNSKLVAMLGTLVPQAQRSLYLSKLPATGGPSSPVLASDGNAVVQNDVTWLPGSRVILARAAVTGGVQLFSSRVAEDSSLTGPFPVSGQSGTGVTSYQIAPIR